MALCTRMRRFPVAAVLLPEVLARLCVVRATRWRFGINCCGSIYCLSKTTQRACMHACMHERTSSVCAARSFALRPVSDTLFMCIRASVTCVEHLNRLRTSATTGERTTQARKCSLLHRHTVQPALVLGRSLSLSLSFFLAHSLSALHFNPRSWGYVLALIPRHRRRFRVQL